MASSCSVKHPIQVRIIFKVKWLREIAQLGYSEKGAAITGIGTVQDITELKKQEAEKQLLRTQLTHTGRVVTLGELTGRYCS